MWWKNSKSGAYKYYVQGTGVKTTKVINLELAATDYLVTNITDIHCTLNLVLSWIHGQNKNYYI